MWNLRLANGTALAPLEPWHAEEFAEHMDHARDHIRPWVGPSFLSSDVPGARAVLQRYADGQARDEMRLVGIWSDERLVGGVMLFDFRAGLGVCETGCWLEPDAEGRGLMSAALTETLRWVFQVRNMRRVEWRTVPANQRSTALAERVGFAYEGTMRRFYPDGRDQVVYAILADEFTAEGNQAMDP